MGPPEHVQQATSYYEIVIAAHVAARLGTVSGPNPNPSVGFRAWLDIDGGVASPNYPGILGVYIPNSIAHLPILRGMVYELGGGTHRFRYQGDLNPYTVGSYNANTPGYTPLVCNWSAQYDPVLTGPPGPTPGPSIIVVPGREVTLNVSALPLLPFQPHEGLSWEKVDGPPRGMKFPRRSYEIVHPRLLVAYRRWRLPWVLTDVDAATLVTFLAGLRTAEGCFRWKAPDRPDEKPYRVKGFQETWRGAGSRRIECESLELVWYTP